MAVAYGSRTYINHILENNAPNNSRIASMSAVDEMCSKITPYTSEIKLSVL